MTIKLKPPVIPYEGWTIEEDNALKTFDPEKLVLHLEPEQETSYLSGTVMHERMRGKGFSASVLDYLIEHPELTPESWKEKSQQGYTQYIYFWGTIYRVRNGHLYVRCWYWHGGRWQSDSRWLDSRWSGDDPSVLLASTQSSDVSAGHLDTQSLELRVAKLEKILEHYKLTETDV